MTRISPRHPRYRSLLLRDELARAARQGIVVPEGLIAQGRGEAFDYLLGERTTPSARRAIRRAAEWMRSARRPVLSVNGNVAALASDRVARLAKLLPNLGIEVNLFHRTPERVRRIGRRLAAAGVRPVLGLRPTVRIPHLPSDRARVDARGIAVADLCIIPLEDGDRTEALRRLGKRIVAIDLNPLSRTAQSADLTIVDELTRALDGLLAELERTAQLPAPRRPRGISNRALLDDAIARIRAGARPAARRPGRRRPRRRARRGRSAGRPRKGTGRR